MSKCEECGLEMDRTQKRFCSGLCHGQWHMARRKIRKQKERQELKPRAGSTVFQAKAGPPASRAEAPAKGNS
jgi:hypothetical protein